MKLNNQNAIQFGLFEKKLEAEILLLRERKHKNQRDLQSALSNKIINFDFSENFTQKIKRQILRLFSIPVIGSVLRGVKSVIYDAWRAKKTAVAKVVNINNPKPRFSNGKSAHQLVSALFPFDAVSSSVILCQKLLTKLGYESAIYVQHINGAVPVEQHRYTALTPSKDDILLFHHCMGTNLEKWFVNLANSKMIVYHNITPTEFFKQSDPNYQNSILGRQQLKTFLPHTQSAIAVSPYNAEELTQIGYQNVATIPLLFTLEELQDQAVDDIVTENKSPNGYLLLHIGRLVRNKCIHEIIESYAQLQYLLDQPSNLIFIGKAPDSKYLKELQQQCIKLGISEQVKFLGPLEEAKKKAFLKHANAYLCLSEHEGFCVPLIEAAVNGVPIVAYDSSNIKNTLDNSGIILQDKNPEKVAACLSLLNKDAALRGNVLEKQYQMLEKYQEDKLLAQLKQALSIPRQIDLIA